MQCDVQTLSQLSSSIRALTDAKLMVVITRLYCSIAAHYNVTMDCTPQGLATAAQQFECCFPDGFHRPAQTFLLAQIRAALVPGASTDPQVIADQSKCFECGFGNNSAMDTLLLCNILTALGG